VALRKLEVRISVGEWSIGDNPHKGFGTWSASYNGCDISIAYDGEFDGFLYDGDHIRWLFATYADESDYEILRQKAHGLDEVCEFHFKSPAGKWDKTCTIMEAIIETNEHCNEICKNTLYYLGVTDKKI